MHHANAGKIKYPARSPKKSLTHSPAPLCGTPRRNSARASWAAGFIGQHCRALKLGQRRKTEDFAHSFILPFPRPARVPPCAACRWQMPRSVTYSRSTRVFLCRFGYSFRRQPAPREPPLARCSRGSGARFALTTRAPPLRFSLRNAHPSRVRENDIPTSSRGALPAGLRFLGQGRSTRTLPPWGIPLGELAIATAHCADAPARRCAAQGKDFMRSHLQADAPAQNSRDCALRRRSHTWQPQGDISPFSPCGQYTRSPGAVKGAAHRFAALPLTAAR